MSMTKELKEIPITQIESESDRKYGGNGNIEVLAESMKKIGLIHAILVRKTESNTYTLIAGRRRLEAAKLLGWEKIPADILQGELPEYDEEMALAENVNRQEMHPLDEAAYFYKLLDSGMEIKEIAKLYDRSVSGIYQRTRLMNLIDPIKQMFRDGKLNLSGAAALAAFDENTQTLFYEENKNKDGIHRWVIIEFIRKANLLPLCGIADNQCADCKRRTFFENPELFDDYSSINDVCFDFDCYSKKWEKLLAEKVENAKNESPETPNILILRCQAPFIGKRDKTVQISGAEFSIKSNKDVYWVGENDDADEIDPSEIITAFLVEIDCGELTVESRKFVDIEAHEKRAYYHLYTGKEFDGSYQAAKGLPRERLFALLKACDFSDFNAPRIETMANPITDEEDFASSELFQFSGMSVAEYTELYKNAVMELTDAAVREDKKPNKEKADEE